MAVSADPHTEATLQAVLDALDPADRVLVEIAADAASAVREAARHWDFDTPARVADAALPSGDRPARDALRRALVASWALDLPVRASSMDLPPEVEALIAPALARLAGFLAAGEDPYDADFWAKDVRFALGLTVPCGAQVVDLYARLGPGEVLHHVRARRDLAPAVAYVRAEGWGAWLQIHTEQRDLQAFDAAGWDACYLRIASLLKRRPLARGMIGSSWFYDPALPTISPRLAYLQEPLAHGGFALWQGEDALYTARATQTSPTRRKLVEEGLYRPASWVLAWPRAAMIRWADAYAATRPAPSDMAA